MAKYRILAVDDEMSTNKKLFTRLFEGDSDFILETAATWDEYNRDRLLQFDAILLDVNLDHWGKTLLDAFKIVGGICPVVLVSQHWEKSRTHQKISDALAAAKQVILAGTLCLNDLGGDEYKEHVDSMRSQLRLVISRHRQQGALELGPDDCIRILHLSDPQYCDKNEDELAFLVEKEIPKFILNELRLKIHFIAITGDITFSGQPSEFTIAETKLQQLVEQFLPNREDWRERLLIVPGNHDVDLRLAAADRIKYMFGDPKDQIVNKPDSVDTSHRRYGLQAFRDFAWSLSGNSNWRDSDDLLWINDSFRHLGIRFYMLNSAADIDSINPKKYSISAEKLSRMVNSDQTDQGLFGMALSHHGPVNPGDEMCEPIENWSQVSKIILTSPVKVFIHGHGHARLADVITTSTVNENNGEFKVEHRDAIGTLGKDEILRIMAPTTHLNGIPRPIGERRGFNIITLNRMHGKVDTVEVDSYDLSEKKPRRSKHAPWDIHV